ncbi:TetR/AcrR family transcriptional regulator [Clostridium sp.]|uniref:TetR/AcrR family transcriptional regulator n=1 Tax=Clostridium sp. TaxID=1506 RepID=UPI00290E2336|nr:TetR/AcrR family transcriptional regulator [Clostridium sp.]MDU7240355.1 TetR/AcrR family transcriptional regulator [Clostridium sp.]
MDNKTTDRRIRKTKNALKDGLIELMLEKNINDISVRELTEKVDLNRGTFYLHYKDIFDLLESIEDDLFKEFNKIMDSHYSDNLDPRPLPLLEDIFIFLKNNAAMTAILLGRNGDIAFVNKIKDIIREKCLTTWSIIFNSSKTDTFDYFYTYILSGCIGLFEAWLNKGLKESPYDMAILTETFILKGVEALK